MEKLLEGFWDCTSCGNREISGLKRECPNCGNPRGEDVEFYLTESSRELTEEEARQVSDAPDWLCPYCGKLNSGLKAVCQSCGSSKSESTDDYFSIQKKHSPTKTFTPTEPDTTQSSKSILHKLTYKTIATGIGIIGLVAFIIFLLITALSPKSATLTVNQMEWVRTIAIEEERTFQESGWSMPTNARLHYTNTEIKGYRDVLDHYGTETRTVSKRVQDGYKTVTSKAKNNGNGTFKTTTKQVPKYKTIQVQETYQDPVYRKEPIYATRYYYEIDRWVYKRKVETTAKDENPKWGKVTLSANEREGSKHEVYKLHTTDQEGKVKTYKVDFTEWSAIDKGDVLNVKIHLGNNLEILEEAAN